MSSTDPRPPRARAFKEKDAPPGPVVELEKAEETTDYAEAYSENRFKSKLARYALTAGQALVEKALTLFYVLRDPDTPTRAKVIIVGALGYFIVPLDAIPDLIPGAGFSDDLGALAIALTLISTHVKPEHTARAHRAAVRIFNPRKKA
jgi:uncharacterized membrane protein YkvA (DUF1232 family)